MEEVDGKRSVHVPDKVDGAGEVSLLLGTPAPSSRALAFHSAILDAIWMGLSAL